MAAAACAFAGSVRTFFPLPFDYIEDMERQADMRPSDVLEKSRELIRDIVSRRQLSNPRVYGSVLRGEDRPDRDLDILVDPSVMTTLLTLGGVEWKLEEALGVPVDVKVPGDFPADVRRRILAEALAI